MPQPNLSDIAVPAWVDLGDWTAHRLQSPTAYGFNKEYAAIRLSVASAATAAASGGTKAVKGASRAVQLRSFSALTGSTGIWAEYDLMTSVWLSFSVVSLYRSSGMQPIMAFQQAAMACTIPDYAGTADGEDQKYAAAALKVSAQGFGTIARHNEKGREGAAMIAAVLTRPGYGRHTGDKKVESENGTLAATGNSRLHSGVDRNTWLHMRWYDGGVIPYFMCHDWSLDSGLSRLTSQDMCPLVDSCYDITIWLNDLSDYALDRTIGEGGNSLVYALSQSGECNPAVLADFCSDVLNRVCDCECDSTLHERAADIAVGFTAMYALAFRYRGLENAWLARRGEIPGVVRKGWLIQGGSMGRHEWPRMPYGSDWRPLSTTLPAQVDFGAISRCWRARCGRLAEAGPGYSLVNHVVSRFVESRNHDVTIVCQALGQMWRPVEPAVQKLGGDSAAIYATVEMLVTSILEWPAIFAAPEQVMGQCSVRDKVNLENTLLGSAAYGLWCCSTSETSALTRFLTGLVASISELTVVATYRRIPTLWSENELGWDPTEHMDCTHTHVV
ncbi:hypothetical protein HIM_08174 [Hirsutella minnesotensis 3608]|uniref:Uncharacterized protein n=1 Tax=Hirsutella minnesotensis 3608 TaxID=1043627 RepID=A0A0F7ZMS4_9HYPO|nr:hypothetical protein HIM_08174 [Hirsutella minnesotensis 3608]